jgi:hypothetical protein
MRADGTLLAFEIGNAFVWIGTILRILRSVEGVTDIKCIRSEDDRVVFLFRDARFVVNEPWGDSSRYWIGPKEPKKAVDLDSLHQAFQQHRGPLSLGWRLFSKSQPPRD